MAARCRTRIGKRRLGRRSFLQASVLAGGGIGLSLADILRLRAAASSGKRRAADDTAIIQIWLGGGISQFESWDPKPEAPREIRGPWRAIDTRLTGVRFCELLPRQAKLADRMAIVRSFWHTDGSHAGGTTICATGKPQPGDPSAGSTVAKLRGSNGFGMPAYVQLKTPTTKNPTFVLNFDAQYLGSSFNPLDIEADPSSESFQVPNLEFAAGLSLDRLDDRRRLLTELDRYRRAADSSDGVASMDHFQQAAFEMLTAPRTRAAFDLGEEDPKLRDRYGRHRWGQSALLARRLVEAGVTFVSINTAPDSILWDIHGAEAGTVTDTMEMACLHLDAMVSTLTEDLYDRGLDRKVLLVVWGEFGRTPTINKRAGRDHWPKVGSLAFVGGGLRMGQVIGESDAKGAVPRERPVRPEDVLATMYHHLGIDPSIHFETFDGRPIPILSAGEAISELVGSARNRQVPRRG